jgi:ABC-2 type transport system permease protein
MKNIINVMMKELKIYFVSPIAYTVFTIFLLLCSYFFVLILFHTKEVSMNYLFGNMTITILFIMPMLTMRLLSEEKRLGTIEILMTSPLTEFQLVFGKFLACFLLFSLMIALTFLYPIWLLVVGEPDKGPLLTGYLGLLFLGISFISLGVFCSALTKNQIISAVLTFGCLLIIWVLGWAGDETKNLVVRKILHYLCLLKHYDDFRKGVIDTKNIFYYLTFTGFFLYLATRMVQARKWR